MGEFSGEEAERSRDRASIRVKKQSVSISEMEKGKKRRFRGTAGRGFLKESSRILTAVQEASTGLAGVNQSILQGGDSCDSLEDWEGRSGGKDGARIEHR